MSDGTSRPEPSGAEQAAAAEVADGLRDAWQRIGEVYARHGADQAERWQKRLLAVATASKRDVVDARDILTRFQRDIAAFLAGKGPGLGG
jgi:hypothetical protein